MKQFGKILALCLTMGLLAGCGPQNSAGSLSENATGSAASGSAAEGEAREVQYEAENKEYGIALPERAVFMEQFEDLIYRTHATKPTDEAESIYDFLEEKHALNRDLNAVLSYKEAEEGSYFDEPDEEGRRYYVVRIHFQIQRKGVFIFVFYTARGLCFEEAYDSDSILYAGDEWNAEDYEEAEEEGGTYTRWGEEVLHIDESVAEQYVPSGETDPQREQIRTDCLKQIEKYLKEDKQDQEFYIYDFFPGDEWLEGMILYTDPMDVVWLHIHVCYKGKKMETYNGVHWYPRTSIMGWEQELQESVHPENCFMAYRFKDGELISLKKS